MAANSGSSNYAYSNLEVAPSSGLIHEHDAGADGYHGYYDPVVREKLAVAQTDPRSHPIAHQSPIDEKILYTGSYATVPPSGGDSNGQPHELSVPLLASPTICGIRRKIFWVIVGVVAFLVVAAAVGGGVGAHFASKSRESQQVEEVATTEDNDLTSTPSNPSRTDTNSTTATETTVHQNLTMSAIQWTDSDGIDHYCVYTQPLGQSRILESAWDSRSKKWTVTSITDQSVAIKKGTPISAVWGLRGDDVVKTVYFLQPGGSVVERQFPFDFDYKWGNADASGTYETSDNSSLFAYWYQHPTSSHQILANFFRGPDEKDEMGMLTIQRYDERMGVSDGWTSNRQNIPIQDGSALAAAPVGSGINLRLYVGDTDGKLSQYPYDLQKNVIGEVSSTPYDLPPNTPLCITTEDNTDQHLSSINPPECVTSGAGLTHLILFASPDRRSLNLVSWNCTSGFVDQQDQIADLLQPNRTYLGLASTTSGISSITNGTFENQGVFVMFIEDSEDEGEEDPQLQVEQWLVPSSGAKLDIQRQNRKWESGGLVPIEM